MYLLLATLSMAVFHLLNGSSAMLSVLITLIFFALAQLVLWKRRRPNRPLPPGPPGEFLLGHIRIIPTENPEYAYQKWSKEYKSDILSFNVLGQPVIVLNSARAAIDLLDKRGGNYCDRPAFTMFEELGWRRTLTFLQWGPVFRLHRRVLQKNLQKSNIIQYRPLQERETAVMLQGLLETPVDNWEKPLRRFATAVVLGISFGLNIESYSDPSIQLAEDVSYTNSRCGPPGGTPVDFFPFLRRLPSWCHDRTLKFARDWRWAIRKLHDKPLEALMSSEEKTISFAQALLDQRQVQIDAGEDPELSIDDVKGAASALFAAGQDTTFGTLLVFILNMVLNPEVQVRARQILDDVVGRERLPSFEDREKLRYIDFVLQETLRWSTVTPMGVPHRSLQEDTYNGYLIPAKSLVFANARAMNHDESIYSNPSGFDPDRYIPVEEGGRGEPFPVGQFGFGRRACVGKHLAESSLWIVIASMLSTMSIEKAKDAQKREITPKVELTSGLTCHPKSFPCRVVPRDEHRIRIIEESAMKRNAELQKGVSFVKV